MTLGALIAACILAMLHPQQPQAQIWEAHDCADVYLRPVECSSDGTDRDGNGGAVWVVTAAPVWGPGRDATLEDCPPPSVAYTVEPSARQEVCWAFHEQEEE